MTKNEICWFTSASRSLYQNNTYKKCLDSWNKIPYPKVLFGEENFSLNGFQNIDIDNIIRDTDFFTSKKRKGVIRRFYFKAVSIFWALKNLDYKFIVWLDADIEVLKIINVFPSFADPTASLWFSLNQDFSKNPKDFLNGGIDTGMIIFNKELIPSSFADEYIDYWHSEKIYNLEKAKDTFVFKDLSKKYPSSNLLIDYKFLPFGSNYFENTIFKGYLHHHIGRGNK